MELNNKVIILEEPLNFDTKYKNMYYITYDLYKTIPQRKKYNLYSIEIKDDLYVEFTDKSESNKNKIVKFDKNKQNRYMFNNDVINLLKNKFGGVEFLNKSGYIWNNDIIRKLKFNHLYSTDKYMISINEKKINSFLDTNKKQPINYDSNNSLDKNIYNY